jgi:hypothetical protein
MEHCDAGATAGGRALRIADGTGQVVLGRYQREPASFKIPNLE